MLFAKMKFISRQFFIFTIFLCVRRDALHQSKKAPDMERISRPQFHIIFFAHYSLLEIVISGSVFSFDLKFKAKMRVKIRRCTNCSFFFSSLFFLKNIIFSFLIFGVNICTRNIT